MKQTKKMINFRISEQLAEALREASDRLEIPQSQIVREAVKEKVAGLKASAESAAAKEVATI